MEHSCENYNTLLSEEELRFLRPTLSFRAADGFPFFARYLLRYRAVSRVSDDDRRCEGEHPT